jgi:hypothetical protein
VCVRVCVCVRERERISRTTHKRTDASFLDGGTSKTFDNVSSGTFEERRDFEAVSLSSAVICERKET